MKTFNIVLFNPKIPPNTGNIIRLCANTGSKLHLIKPLGFELNEKSLRRAGLDYDHKVKIEVYETIEKCLKKINCKKSFLVTKFGDTSYDKQQYNLGDCFIFGSETKGLPKEIFQKFKKFPRIFIPMIPNNRSINLANAVSICVYEAWKQNN